MADARLDDRRNDDANQDVGCECPSRDIWVLKATSAQSGRMREHAGGDRGGN
jgi:hypothetical protein